MRVVDLPHDPKQGEGCWWIDPGAVVSIVISCPTCGARGVLDHGIDENGIVSPSVVCPSECGFHRDIRLSNWPGWTVPIPKESPR